MSNNPTTPAILEEGKLICQLTNEQKKITSKEQTMQSVISMMIDEYGFAPEDMQRDLTLKSEDDEGKSWKKKIDLIIFRTGEAHEQDHIHPPDRCTG